MIKLAITIGCLEIGGAEIFILNLLKRLNYQKYQVLLIVLSKKSGTFIESEIEKLPIIIRYMNKKEGFRSAGVNQNYRASVAVFSRCFTRERRRDDVFVAVSFYVSEKNRRAYGAYPG